MLDMPTPKMVKTNGIDMAVYEAGPKDGVPVVFCHGFPELAFSWRYQIKALANAGFHVLAPDQRGYGLTSRPEKIEDYDMKHLTGDLAGMLAQHRGTLGKQQRRLVPHHHRHQDCGGFP